MRKVLLSFVCTIGLILFLFTGCKSQDPYLNLSGYDIPNTIQANTDYNIEGIIKCNDTIKCAGIRIKDVDSNVYEISKTLNNHENEFDLLRLNQYIDFGKLSKGEKFIEVIAVRSNYPEVLAKNYFTVS